jgi:hypothetical protein
MFCITNRGSAALLIGLLFSKRKEELKTGIEKTGLLRFCCLTHIVHLDHVFGNKFVPDNWGLSLHLHENEKTLLEDHALNTARCGNCLSTTMKALWFI